MAKKNQEAAPPAISTIPLPDQESPLVIDLPDGQKLVVGNIAHGTVIEVATWRGTGRPDSRTSRLMLGVSSAAAAENQNTSVTAGEPSARSEPVKQNPIKNFLSSLVAKTPQRRQAQAVKEIDRILQDEVVTTTSAESKVEKESENSSRVSKALNDPDDIQSWLDELMSGTSTESPTGSESRSRAARVKRISSAQSRGRVRSKPKAKQNSTRTSISGPRKTTKNGSRKTKKR